MKKVLVINAGSSSIKLTLFDKDTLEPLASGLAERITLPIGMVTLKFNGSKQEHEVALPDHSVAVQVIIDMMMSMQVINEVNEIEYIGFRIVQGGPYFDRSSKLSECEIELIEKVSMYAPLHNPGAVQAINAFRKFMPHAKLSANFDTAFHTTINKVNSTYPIPRELSEKYGIKKYGAHGISHRFITQKLSNILNKDKVNFVNLHIGNGASLCAVKDSLSFDTSMGLTPLAGIMMGTRSGDIDPSIHQFVLNATGIDINEFTDILNKKSGLLGVSGVSSDMRDIVGAARSGNEQAQFALDLYSQKIADYTAIYLNKIGPKIDAIVFTAGVGENSPYVRQNVLSRLNILNIKLDNELNFSKIDDFKLISSPESSIPVYVIRTNEELLIAQDALKLYE
ncbi:acetate kinase [Mycoplasmopsis pullorum]|uniref:acetate/propionate family kinase n=1 Tax=Mycoplasmopsis pullorum TaxID=48003 RepID=UPI0011196076|nr:acetate/propionate family kinase [Mycoplasmopsis pullorum]TNK82614.1 acetate kinase [Mycoplasmopsis pullorum]TNK83513.1 acetate kinase [Mycoplasmopsis pullorum]TNK84929.1 acetate kinase [Mycoplasmopsis pullorum]TNK86262.1 acetate kinase [Mycoplasmopsis pullorum]TNK86907.1 acetate kinase [Mycoplasmopsis pullorum]